MKQERIRDSIGQLNRDMSEKSLEGHWNLGLEDLPPYPVTTVQPCLWRWEDVHESMIRAGEVVNLEQDAERRTIRLLNPGIPGGHGTTHHPLLVPVREARRVRARAPAHGRGLPLRAPGQGAYTMVDGQQCVMEEGDLILTPQLTWHDHVNDSGEPIIWLDGLDIPLTQALHQLFFEPYHQEQQAWRPPATRWPGSTATPARRWSRPGSSSTTSGPIPSAAWSGSAATDRAGTPTTATSSSS